MKRLPVVGLVLLLVPSTALAVQTEVRVGTYNIRWLDADDLPNERRQKLREVITLLEADVIGLQEIDDRAALSQVFTGSDWQLVIDDDSGERQDLAVAVRRPLEVEGLPGDLDADQVQVVILESGYLGKQQLCDSRAGPEGCSARVVVWDFGGPADAHLCPGSTSIAFDDEARS